MKKLFAFAGLMMAAIVALTNCQKKELEPQVRPDGIKLVMATDDTKTTNDGMSTLWAEKDRVGVFFQDVTGGYETLGAFNLTGGAGTKNGTFEPASTETEGFAKLNTSASYNWYAFYPYSGGVKTPASTDDEGGYIYIGQRNGINQDGYDSSAAICGSNCALYAKKENATVSELTNSVTVKHLTSLIEFELVNQTGQDIIISSVTLTASEPVVGSFYVDVTGSEPAYISSGDQYVKKEAAVFIQNAGTLANGSSAKAYLPIKPYTQSASEPFKVEVTGSIGGNTGSKEFSSVLASGKNVFEAGKVKKIKLNIDSMAASGNVNTVAEVLSGTVGEEYTINGAQVTSVVGSSYFVTDATGTIMCYKSGHGLAIGDIVNVQGKTKAYNNLVEFDGPVATKVSGGTRSITPAVWSTSDMVAAYGNAQIAYVTYEAEFTGSRNAPLTGTDIVLYTTNASGVSISKDKTYKVTGYVYGWMDFEKDSKVTKEVCMYVESAEEVTGGQTATLEISPKSMTFEAAGGSKEVTVTCDNEKWSWGQTPDWATLTREGNKVTVTVAENTGEEKREGEIVFTHPAGELTATLKITQKGTVVEDVLTLSAASISFASTDTEAKKITVNCNSSEWSVDASTVPSWLTVQEFRETDPDSGKPVEYFTVKAAVNTDTEARNATIVVKHPNGELTRNLAVAQNGASSSGAKTYTLVTSASQLTDGEYIIVFTPESGGDSFAMNGGLSTLDAASNGVKVTVSGASINYSGDDVYFTYDATEGSLLGAGGKYLAHTGSSNKINSVTKYAEASCKLAITFDGANAVITAPSGYIVRYNVSSGQDRFRFYKSTSTDPNLFPVQLYKKN